MLKIKEARKKAGLTQLQLASKVNITPVYLSYIETDHKNPSIKLLEKISKELHVNISDLF